MAELALKIYKMHDSHKRRKKSSQLEDSEPKTSKSNLV